MATANGATIIYDGGVIAEVSNGKNATLRCAEQKMAGDVVVQVEVAPNLQQQTVTVSGNDTLEVTPAEGFDGLSKVTVVGAIPDGYVQPSGTKEITENGSHDVSAYASVEVAVQGSASGALTINGVIEQYQVGAGATVNAGDFVEFVNNFGSGYFEENALYYVTAAKLDESRVLVAYSLSTANNNDAYAKVLTLADGEVTIGAAVSLGRSLDMKLVTLSQNKAVLVYYDYQNAGGAAAVLTVNGDTITMGTSTQFTSGQIDCICAVSLSDSKILAAYRHIGNSEYGTAVVLTVDDTAITAGTTKIFEYAQVGYVSAVALSDGKALVAYTDFGDSSYGTATVLSVTGSTISQGATTVFHQIGTFAISTVALSDSEVLAVYDAYSNDVNYGMAIKLSVNGTSITAGTPQAFCETAFTDTYAVALTDSKVLIAFRNASASGYGTAVVLNLDGTSISTGEMMAFAEKSIYYPNLVATSGNSVLVVHGNSAGWYVGLNINGTTITTDGEPGTVIQPATSRLYNVGVAATSGAEGEMVDVYVVG